MSDVVIASNITTKVSAKVNLSNFFTSYGSATSIYTVPANSYAILQVSFDSSGGCYLSADTNRININTNTSVYFGPGASVNLFYTSAVSERFSINGVVFINSP